MTIRLTPDALRKIWPKAPQTIIDAFISRQDVLDRAGVNHTRTRLAFALSQVEHETGGWTIKNLTENINYSAGRAAQIWPSRFPGGASQVQAKYGTAAGWQLKMFDDVYGNRMGNRPGTHDGSAYIGRAGPQVTGRDGYREVGARAGAPLVERPDLATRHDLQPEILAAFWSWKNLNSKADVGDYKGCTRLWNGGLIGYADREHLLVGNDPIIERLEAVEAIEPTVRDLPGSPPTKAPPKEVIDNTTTNERRSRTGGAATGGAGGVSEAGKASTEQPDKPGAGFMPSVMAWTLIGAGVAIIIVATILIARKRAKVIANWN